MRRLADRLVGRHMNNTPDASGSVGFKHIADALFAFEVGFDSNNLSVLLVFSGSIGGQGVQGNLRDTAESLGMGIVVVIDGDDLEPPCQKESEDNMRS